jgi:hypothetical protein
MREHKPTTLARNHERRARGDFIGEKTALQDEAARNVAVKRLDMLLALVAAFSSNKCR